MNHCLKKEPAVLDPVLLSIAKNAILLEFDESFSYDKARVLETYPSLKEIAATFVTLEYDHHLRGCIGSIIAHRTLYDDIVKNAVAAAFEDPRFHPLNDGEFPHISIEVSLLSSPELLEYENFTDLLTKVEPFIDGLILRHKGHHGTFLPQVWEQLKSPKEFLEHLCIKAGLSPAVYDEHPLIYRYRVETIKGNFEDIPTLK